MPKIKERTKGKFKKEIKIKKCIMIKKKIWDIAFRLSYDKELSISEYIARLILRDSRRDEQGRTIYTQNKEKQEMLDFEDDFELGDE